VGGTVSDQRAPGGGPHGDGGGLWVRSDVLPDGSYGVTVNVGADRAWTLPRRAAEQYAVACHDAAVAAEHDAAVVRLLTAMGMDLPLVGQFVAKDLRPGRPAERLQVLRGLRYLPGVTAQGLPFVDLELAGDTAGQVSPVELQVHAAAVLACLAAVELDAALFRLLTGRIGLDPGRARQVVGSLGDHWPSPNDAGAGTGGAGGAGT
jgi:hypothetical protein